MKQLKDSFDQGQIILDLEATDIKSAITKTVHHMVMYDVLPKEVENDLVTILLEREENMPTAIGNAMAVPHAYLDKIKKLTVIFVRLAQPANLGAPDGIPTQFLFFLLGPTGSAAQHLDTLANIARLMSDNEFRFELGKADSGHELQVALENFMKRTTIEPKKTEIKSDSLEYTGRFCGGLMGDIARRKPYYIKDFIDGFHPKCLGATLFLFFACLAPAVTFGGVMTILTNDHIGAVEMIVASAFCGVVYALFSGQPLIILGGTGPLLVFTAILYRLCSDLHIPFLPSYGWVGIWSGIIILIMSFTDASCLMKYFTRFTNEIFSALISIIFIYEAIKSLVYIFEDLEIKKHHDTALLSLLLALGTFYIAMNLSRLRRSNYLRSNIREFLADFGPAIAIASMTVISVWLNEVFLDILPAPDSFGTTNSRPWTVNLMSTPAWVPLAAIGPALLVSVLVYLDQNITARIINSPDHKLQKGDAYHLDLGVVGVLIAICSIFGLPWLVAATVRSLNHVRSLATVEEVIDPKGGSHEHVIYVRENRLTGLTIHLLIGASLLLLPLLKSIPLAVLYGLFLFMGVVSMSGNQFFERLSLWLKDPALYPVTHYIRRVPNRIIHYFTLLQLTCLGILWIVKESQVGILFPIFIALLVPVRLLANKFFSEEHLNALDAE